MPDGATKRLLDCAIEPGHLLGLQFIAGRQWMNARQK
jgi:hypothetical protein